MAFDAAAARFESPLGAPSLHLPAADPPAPALRTRPAPLLPMQRAWLKGWSAHLDPRHHPSVSGSALVSAVLRSVPSARDERPARSLAAWPAVQPATPRPGAPTLEPRSMGGHLSDGGAPRRRTAELLAALSSGLDAAEGRVGGHSIRTALIATRLAEALDLTEHNREALLYAGLLRDAGTTGRGSTSTDESGRPVRPPANQPAHLSRPDRAAAVIRSLTLPSAVAEAVCSVDERWDGRGPLRLRRDVIPTGARVLAVASAAADAVGRALATATRGTTDLAGAAGRAADGTLRGQRGHELDPLMVDTAVRHIPAAFWKRLVETNLVEQLLEAEPAGDIRRSTPEHIDTVCATFADLVDTRTPMMGRHGVRVADLAHRVASRMGFDPLECRELRRAGLLHDIGKLLVPIAYLEKATELTDTERSVIRDHPRVGAEILRRSRVLAGLAPLVAGHHEALDGEGNFPEFAEVRMAQAARILAVCDRYEAMTSERPYRPLLTREQVWHILEEAATEPMARQAFLALRAVADAE